MLASIQYLHNNQWVSPDYFQSLVVDNMVIFVGKKSRSVLAVSLLEMGGIASMTGGQKRQAKWVPEERMARGTHSVRII